MRFELFGMGEGFGWEFRKGTSRSCSPRGGQIGWNGDV